MLILNKKIFLFIALGLIFILLAFYVFTLPKQNKGIITLTFDDGVESHYDFVFKEMQKYNYSGTLFLMANWSSLFEGKELMDFEDAREMQDFGWEIGSHSLNHRLLTILPEKELEDDLSKSKEILEDKGFMVFSLAYPYGHYNQFIKNTSSKYYDAIRSLDKGYNSFENIDFFNLKSKVVKSDSSTEEICSWIKKANSQELWLVLVFHDVGEEKDSWTFSEQKFKEVLKCIIEEDIEVKTIKEVLKDEERI